MLIGRCSQDDGAPPLWPWKTVLDGSTSLVAEEQDAAEQDEGGQFRLGADHPGLRKAAGDETIMVVLDDLHWADTTLRVLRLLVETTDQARLLVVTTAWRAHPERPARRGHALRLQLSGLPQDQMTTVFEERHQPRVDPAEALYSGPTATRSRRIARPAGSVAIPARRHELPTAVTDVLTPAAAAARKDAPVRGPR